MAEIRVGTSGWHYAHWVGPFYPEGTKSRNYLAHYCTQFRAAEINNTFYQLPKRETLTAWREESPGDMVFACKASRYITHMKKLKDPEQSCARFFQAVAALGDKLGPILFQLPPRWGVDEGRLANFLDRLPAGRRYAFEFRDESWHCRAVYDALAERNAAFCAFEFDGRRAPVELTADFAYVRLHGPGGPYEGNYDGRTLFGWVRRMLDWRAAGIDVYCFFDNDEQGFAAMNAAHMRDMITRY